MQLQMGIKYKSFNTKPFEAHTLAYSYIRPNSKVLDIGCATGYFARELIKKGCLIWGIEQDRKAAKEARRFCEKVYNFDLERNKKLPLSHRFFDYILFLDILEHLIEPQLTLQAMGYYLRDDGYAIVSIPNIAHVSIRLNLLFGRFDYQEMGILDRAHLRFFTKRAFLLLLKRSGFTLRGLDYSSDFGQIPLVGRVLKFIPKLFQYKLTKLFNTFLAVQFIAVCEKKKQ